jgi:hypothetical protein
VGFLLGMGGKSSNGNGKAHRFHVSGISLRND